MFRILVAFYRCVPIFKAVEQLKNLHVAYEFLSRGSFNSPIGFGLFSQVLPKILYAHIVSYLDIMNTTHYTRTALHLGVNVLDGIAAVRSHSWRT